VTVTAAWAVAAEAGQLAAELGCEVIPHPVLPGVIEAHRPAPGVFVIAGTPESVRAQAHADQRVVRAAKLREWLPFLGTLTCAEHPGTRAGRQAHSTAGGPGGPSRAALSSPMPSGSRQG
jgi:hypothetical protein